MAESSRPWPGDSGASGVGDCGPYSADQWDDVWEALFVQDNSASEGVLAGVLNELAQSNPSANTVRIAPGVALVKGKTYLNSANVDVNVPTPSVQTRIDRIVLRSDWTAQTVRVTRIAGTEGGGAPAITQTDGNTWDLKLCQVSISTGGAISLTDERAYCHYATKVSTAMLDDDAVTADKIVNNLDATGIGLNADQVDGIHAAATAQANKLLPLNASGKLPASITGDADTLDGYHASDLLSGGVITGAIIMWFGTLGGSDGHRPMVGGSPNENWHVCNGETVGDVVTPNLQGRIPVGVGGTLGAAKGDVGGNSSLNFSHWHEAGTLVGAYHNHVSSALYFQSGSSVGYESITNVAQSISGNTGSSLGNTNIMNPYLALYFLMKVA